MVEDNKPKEQDVLNNEDLDKLEKDMDNARNTLVSKETEDKIAQAKEEAKKEAEKEFLVNQRIKELEEEKVKLAEDKAKKEEEVAKQLEEMKEKLNAAITSRAVPTANNPFNDKPSSSNIDKLSDDEVNQIEQASYLAFEKRRLE